MFYYLSKQEQFLLLKSTLIHLFYKKQLTFYVITCILNESVATVTDSNECGILAQLGEHLPYKQRVTGSSPVGPINQFYIDYAGVAELADAQDLKSCGTNLPYRFDSGRRQ